ncbi:class I SAM-dependent methyltransferase [Coxiella-like endosymbiont]|nr:class I SAM-dependent methyltransferase [Coxiella-like endosymbiont]
MAALRSIYQALKPGGVVTILEFSKPHIPLQNFYDIYFSNYYLGYGKI